MTDPAPELKNENEKAMLPEEVAKSKIPIKIANYSDKPSTVNLSFEINSAKPEQINVELTSPTVTVPPRKDNTPGVAWVGLNISYPEELKGRLNDVLIWATDKAANRKWHIGVCLFGGLPNVQGASNTYINDLELTKRQISPNGDGEDETLSTPHTTTTCKERFFMQST
jgi:hypothetical protein